VGYLMLQSSACDHINYGGRRGECTVLLCLVQTVGNLLSSQAPFSPTTTSSSIIEDSQA